MSVESNSDKLKVLVKALRQPSFQFIIIGQNHPDVFKDVFSWLNLNLPGRKIHKFPIFDKNYKDILDDLIQFHQDLVLIPDFDILFKPENEDICVAINQRRDFLAGEKMNLICFIRPESFRLLPVKIPDLWSLRSLELEFVVNIKDIKFPISTTIFTTSLGGKSFYEKQAEIERLRHQIHLTDKNNIHLIKALESQLAMLNFEIDQLPIIEIIEKLPNDPNHYGTSIDNKEYLLSILAILSSEPISFKHLEILLPGFENLKEILNSLVQEGWIEYFQKSERFKCNTIKRDEIRTWNHGELLNHWKSLIPILIEKLEYNSDWDSKYFLNVVYPEVSVFVQYAENLVLNIDKDNNRVAILIRRIGDFHLKTGKLEKALSFYEQYLKISKELFTANSQKISSKIEVATAHEKLGDVHTALRNDQKAYSYYKENTRFGKEISHEYPNNSSFKNLLACSYSRLGDNQTKLGNFDEAVSYFGKFYDLEKELCDSSPENQFFKYRLSIACLKLGEINSLTGNMKMALSYYENGLQLSKELYSSWPQNVTFKNGLAISYAKIGVFYQEYQFDDEAAQDYFQKAELLLKELVEDYPNYAEFVKNLKEIRDLIET